jgi:hypothetical protein
VPADPHNGYSDRDVELYNKIADGQPSLWCQWVPCPHGCCLGWDGHEKFYAGTAWMVYLIDHFLRPGAHAAASGDPQFTEFTFDHQMDGLIIGEQGDNRELFAIRVVENEVFGETLRVGEPMPWASGWDGPYAEDRPWLSPMPRRRSSLELPDPPAGASSPSVLGLPSPGTKRRRRKGGSSLG